MDADEDPGGAWPIQPAVAFYGLWPRFAADDESESGAAEPAASGED